jgi:hypothetical protein
MVFPGTANTNQFDGGHWDSTPPRGGAEGGGGRGRIRLGEGMFCIYLQYRKVRVGAQT